MRLSHFTVAGRFVSISDAITVCAWAAVRFQPPTLGVFCLFNRGSMQAVLLAAVEVCALAPTEHGENALRVSTLTGIQLFGSFIRFAGPFAAGWVKEDADWVDPSSNPLDSPELQELVTPVMRDLVTLLVPLLLPDCHGIPLPGSGSADPMGSKLSALLPQVVFLMAAAGVQG